MNPDMEIARQWMLANKLTLNASKTKAMVISPPPKKNWYLTDYSIKCGESPISVRENVKYLGLNIDNKRNFMKPVKIIEGKFACAVGILAKSKHYLPQNVLLQLNHA